MPFALILAGLMLIVTGAKGTTADFLSLLESEFTGKNNFVYWMIAILGIGSLGYIDKIRPISRAFLALVIVVLFISNGGFFQKFYDAIYNNTTETTVPLPAVFGGTGI